MATITLTIKSRVSGEPGGGNPANQLRRETMTQEIKLRREMIKNLLGFATVAAFIWTVLVVFS